jgi:hypothetical protein
MSFKFTCNLFNDKVNNVRLSIIGPTRIVINVEASIPFDGIRADRVAAIFDDVIMFQRTLIVTLLITEDYILLTGTKIFDGLPFASLDINYKSRETESEV